MSTALPRIHRLSPHGPITRPETPIPSIAVIRWFDGREQEVAATAMAWTREAVEITWDAPSLGLRRDWVPAADVFRSPLEASQRPEDDRPHSGGIPRPRW